MGTTSPWRRSCWVLVAAFGLIPLGCGGGDDDGMPAPPDADPEEGPVVAPEGPFFPAGSTFYTDMSDAPLRDDSADIIAAIDAAGGWGGPQEQLRVDFSLEVLAGNENTPLLAFTPTDDHYTPDCDIEDVPVPTGGALEAETGYECAGDGECHLLVAHAPSNKLYEMWRADISDGTFRGGCLAVWDMTQDYGLEGRGANCATADTAGLPIAPLTFSATEVASGEIDHALRFVLPGDRIREGFYVPPATHTSASATGGADTPPFGTWLRLRDDFDESEMGEGAQVVVRAMKQYGIILADGGEVTLTAQSDRFTPERWEGLLGTDELDEILITDFEVIDTGDPVAYEEGCDRL
ncbi:MAG TPA: hypothetical protein VMZ28_07120 [Kofleriaceae bacterium]|nr:hypothetical protein [Kofleriaceae bacterium]